MALVFLIFPLFFLKHSFAKFKVLSWQFFSLKLPWFLWEVGCSYYVCKESLCVQLVTSLWLLPGFSFCLCSSAVWLQCVSVGIFGLIQMEVLLASGMCRFMIFLNQIWEVVGYYFVKHSFCPFLSLLSFWISNMCMWMVGWYPTGLLGFAHLSSFFFFVLFLTLNHLNWPVFKFADSFFCLIKSATDPLWVNFKILVIVLFNSRFFIWFFFVTAKPWLVSSICKTAFSQFHFSSSDMVPLRSLVSPEIANWVSAMSGFP